MRNAQAEEMGREEKGVGKEKEGKAGGGISTRQAGWFEKRREEEDGRKM